MPATKEEGELAAVFTLISKMPASGAKRHVQVASGCAVVSAHDALPQQPAHAILRPAQSGLHGRQEGGLPALIHITSMLASGNKEACAGGLRVCCYACTQLASTAGECRQV
jgi:hypothetical protein